MATPVIRVPRVYRRAPVLKKLRDVIEQPFYDTVRLAHGSQSKILLFQEIVGQGTSAIKGSGPKTELDTNMIESGRVPKGYAYQINGIGVEVVALFDGTNLTYPTLETIQSFAMNTLLKLVIGEKPYVKAPVLFLPAGTGISAAVATTQSATTLTPATLGTPQKVNLRKLAIPHRISENRNFYIELDNTNGNAYDFGGSGRALIVRVYLDGILWRIVQ